MGEWFGAEAFLQRANKHHPEHPTLLLMLAVAQSRRGKLQSAIVSARHACQLQADTENLKLLIDLLLDCGYLNEALELLSQLKDHIAQDEELTYSMIRLHLACRSIPEADVWSERLCAQFSPKYLLVKLGRSYQEAQQDAKAIHYYQQALEKGFYPEALLGLGRIAHKQANKEQARLFLLHALDTTKPVGENGVGPLPLFDPIIKALASLETLSSQCRAWVCQFPDSATSAVLRNHRFMLYAHNRPEAELFAARILKALFVDKPAPQLTSWKEAPREEQPDYPVHPGLQYAFV